MTKNVIVIFALDPVVQTGIGSKLALCVLLLKILTKVNLIDLIKMISLILILIDGLTRLTGIRIKLTPYDGQAEGLRQLPGEGVRVVSS